MEPKRSKKYTQEQKDSIYWRYKKDSPPVDEFADKNGPVKIKLPHPFKCSKCKYVGTSKANLNDHWSLEH